MSVLGGGSAGVSYPCDCKNCKEKGHDKCGCCQRSYNDGNSWRNYNY